MSLTEKQQLRGALVAALERANEASRELNRARIKG